MNFNPLTQLPVHLRPIAALIVVAGLALFSGGAVSENAVEQFARRSVGALGSGFFDPASPPPPEGTIRPARGSWDAVHPPRGYRVVLLTAGDDPQTATVAAAVKQWASAEQVTLATVAVATPERMIDGIVEAIDEKPDLIISASQVLVDPLALVTASHLEQQFLVVGAQLPEPTGNVTAAIWKGASSRGREVPDTAWSFDPGAFTHEQAAAAIRAGVASVLHDLTGIVVALE